MKLCRKCKVIKESIAFHKNSSSKDGLFWWCKICCKNKRNKYYIENKENNKEQCKRWRVKNREQHRKYRRKYNKNARLINLNTKLQQNLRTRLRQAIRTNQKSGSAVSDLGCSIEKFKLWIEIHWQEGMNWNNYGKNGWHIDHTIPLSKFDLRDRNELLKACHYTNLKPMWAMDNYKKGNKI